jgi:hypothetical protein
VELILSSASNCKLGVIIDSHFSGEHIYKMLSVEGEVSSGACSDEVVCYHETTANNHGYQPIESWRKLVNLCDWWVVDGQSYESDNYLVMIASDRPDYLRKKEAPLYFLVFPKDQALSGGTFRGYWKASQGWEIPK